MVPRHVGKPLRLCPKNDKTDYHNKTNKTHNNKTLPRPSANTHDRAHHGGARLSSPAHVTKKDAPRDCGSMKLLDPSVLSPYELNVALGEAEWTKDSYPMDFYEKGDNSWSNFGGDNNLRELIF